MTHTDRLFSQCGLPMVTPPDGKTMLSVQVISGGQEVTLPSGVKYTDLKLGGGTPVQKGYLVILNFKCGSLFHCLFVKHVNNALLL